MKLSKKIEKAFMPAKKLADQKALIYQVCQKI